MEEWDHWLYFVNIYAAHPTLIQTALQATSAGLAVGERSAILLMAMTPCMCVQIYCMLCVLDYYQMSSNGGYMIG